LQGLFLANLVELIFQHGLLAIFQLGLQRKQGASQRQDTIRGMEAIALQITPFE